MVLPGHGPAYRGSRRPGRADRHPDDVAAAVASLIGSGYVTGAVIPCDGGLRLR